MKLRRFHPWDLSPKEAIALQKELASRVVAEDRLGAVRRVAGVDVHLAPGGSSTLAAISILAYPDLELVEEATAIAPIRFPYVPGLLSFREIPAIEPAWAGLRETPDVILCDAHGRAHPRRFGLACHLGLLTEIPTIGVAKSRLTGSHEEVPRDRGTWRPLMDGDQVIGAIVRTRTGVRPVYVSVGHLVSLERAIDFVLSCLTRFRIPEPLRRAHRLAATSRTHRT